MISKKIAIGKGTPFENTLLCCRFSGNVYNYKAQQRVAGEPAVSKTDFTTGSHFFNQFFYNAFTLV